MTSPHLLNTLKSSTSIDASNSWDLRTFPPVMGWENTTGMPMECRVPLTIVLLNPLQILAKDLQTHLLTTAVFITVLVLDLPFQDLCESTSEYRASNTQTWCIPTVVLYCFDLSKLSHWITMENQKIGTWKSSLEKGKNVFQTCSYAFQPWVFSVCNYLLPFLQQTWWRMTLWLRGMSFI